MKKKISRALTSALVMVAISVVVQPSTGHATTIDSTIHGFATDFSPQDGSGDANNPIVVSVSNGFPGKQDRGIIEFNISGLSGAVSSATLRLLITDNNVSGTTNVGMFAVFGYAGDGALLNSDYEASASSIGAFNVAVFQTGSITVDVTDFINAQIALNDPAHFAGFKIVWNSPPSLDFVSFGQSFLDLDVSSTPLPAALPLFATGLAALGLFGWGRRRKAEELRCF